MPGTRKTSTNLTEETGSVKKPTRSSQRKRNTMSKPENDEAIGIIEDESSEVPRGGKRKTSSVSGVVNTSKKSKPSLEKTAPSNSNNDESVLHDGSESEGQKPTTNLKKPRKKVVVDGDADGEAMFIGENVADEDARRRWPKRYQGKGAQRVVTKISNDGSDPEVIIQARRHYTQAKVDGCVIYNLYDDAHVKAEEGEDNYICKIVEMFEAVDGDLYFTAQWFYRGRDTVMKKLGHLIVKKRVFFSEIQDDNPLDCLVEKLNIVKLSLNVDSEAKKKEIPSCDYYCDMLYKLEYSSFTNLPPEEKTNVSEEASSTVSEDNLDNVIGANNDHKDASLLDLYSGCGAMSTGLCLGANMAGLKLVTKWAVDINKYACESLQWNHPETTVRNEPAEDFLALLKEWERLCASFSLSKSENLEKQSFNSYDDEDDGNDEVEEENGNDDSDGEVFEVEKFLAICYGDPKENGERGLHFKVRWKNYGPEEDTWEPLEGLGDCRERLKKFVTSGFNSKLLPLPGDADMICGGPPCQGISGFNRFRNKENPLQDEKNKQLQVFMDIVEYLKPKYVLMENVVDIVKFSEGFLGRYALSQLIRLNYQVRMGMMAAGAYGLPQFRMRAFFWGARPNEKLPQYPLPTHDLIVRGVIPLEFENNTVAWAEGKKPELEKKLLLQDAISDLPPVGNYENRDEMDYYNDPKTEFQRFIRLSREEMPGSLRAKSGKHLLYDHRPLQLNTDDYQRVCRIPKRKGANFRDLPGVLVNTDNKVQWDPNVERVYLESGKPLVPDYAMSFVGGSSSKPFARLWWDETVPTVVTRAEPHNQAILHPEQDRVLSVRENARLQGFPDYYKLFGTVKERYIQVGNAVAVPVSRALGYALGLAYRGGVSSDEPLMKLPSGFPNIVEKVSSDSSQDNS
ncbi:DNA (cytosine-5)-methyltransferase CMT3-like isoform X1 [Hibiscus syriacus]|uniref:DNA (cytosine-5)-methyltransferase CMT3-like isoform X1 n=1 Tax=Hibiscus syriacus TaxID=106335 RepID=UPI001921C237|nr:DNA (cytosine-5)-methyltransferase CMT3-like isoform X1 [Hibiscus syriacus]